VEELVDLLRDTKTEFEVLPHRRTMTAVSEARALGVFAQTVAKTLIARDESGTCIRAVVSSPRADSPLAKLAWAIGARGVQLLSESDLVSAYPQFELGAVPPFGGPAGDRVVVDRTLADTDQVIVEAGVHETSLRLRTEDLLAITVAQVADIGT
jgi:Ala-tRNA(Pro) deacylase